MRPRTIVLLWIAFAFPVLLLAAVLWKGPGPAVAQQRFVWKVQSAWPATNLLHVSAVELAKMIEEMSGGRLKWEMSPAGTVVGAFEVLDAVNRGIIDATHAWPGYWAGKNSAAGLFAPGPGGPFGMDREEYLSWLLAAGGLELYNELLQKELKMNVVVPAFTTSLPYWEPLGWFKKPFNNLDDLRKMRFRTSGLGMEMMKTMGVSVVTLAGNEVIPALERGAVEGAEWAIPSHDIVDGVPERHEVLLHARPAAAGLLPGSDDQPEEVGRAAEGPAGDREVGLAGGDHPHDRRTAWTSTARRSRSSRRSTA